MKSTLPILEQKLLDQVTWEPHKINTRQPHVEGWMDDFILRQVTYYLSLQTPIQLRIKFQ